MNFDVGNPVFLVDYLKWFHVSIKLLPLTGPVGPNLFFPTTRPPCDALSQLTCSLMKHQGAVYIPISR